jgi:hypothetical protein
MLQFDANVTAPTTRVNRRVFPVMEMTPGRRTRPLMALISALCSVWPS